MSDGKSGGKKISRRDLLRVAGAGGAGLTLGAGGFAALRGAANARDAGDELSVPFAPEVPFFGRHQAGIATPQQEHLHFAALDLVSESAGEARELLKAWSEAGGRMAAGEPAGGENESTFLPPDDTGEAFGLSPARLTLTVGFGPTLFEKNGEDRFGLARNRPDALEEIPALPGDALEEGRSGGDLLRPGLRRRPPGSISRGQEPRQDRPRRGRGPLVAARFRPDGEHEQGAGHAAQPHGFQGRHQQHKGGR